MYKNKKFNMSSWKQYGGIYRTDKYHNVAMGTIVADQLILRQTATALSTFENSILVKKDIIGHRNMDISENITSNDLFIRRNIYLNKKLYFGTDTSYNDSNDIPCYIFGSGTGIGINTKTPRTQFDITATNDISNVLTVRSQNAININTIAENNNNKAIIVNASNTSSFIGFYNDTSNNTNNTPDARLQYTASTLSASGILETVSKIVKLSPNVYVYNRGNRTIPSGNTIYDEPMIIYDNSQNNYLYQYYNKNDVKSGNALTLAAIDNSSNTFLRIVAPNKRGMALGGGADPSNNSYSMATFGITDNSGNYYQNQMIIQGTEIVKNKTTLGINTFYPKTNKYALDINGSTRISNGEVNTVSYLNFEVKKISFSKSYPLCGIIVGTASTISNPFLYSISYTKDGGKTWNNSQIDSNIIGTSSREFTVHVYDTSYAIISTSDSFAFYTRNGGINWNQLELNNDNFRRNIKTVFISSYNNNDSTRRIFFGGLVGQFIGDTPIIPTIFYYDVSFNQSSIGNNNNLTAYYRDLTVEARPLSSFLIKNSDGAGDVLYFVGNGIQKLNITDTPELIYYINSNNSYNSVYAYDSSFVVAVGNNIISFTKNGTVWTNITVSNVTFNDVFIYDSISALVVGNNGKFYYTLDGTNWDIVPDTIINSSGISNIITDPSYNLSNIIIPNKESFIISSITNSYNPNLLQLGKSKILYGYYPNLFNRENNIVLELSGNILISGDIEINDNGKLKTNQTTFNLLTENVKTINIGELSTNTNLSGNLAVSENVIVNSNLDIYGDMSLNLKMFVGGDVSMNSKISIRNDVSMNSKLTVENDASFNNSISIKENIYNRGSLRTNNIELIDNNTINIGSTYIDTIPIQPNIFKNINIGHKEGGTRNNSKIIIGSGPDDIIIIKGKLETQQTVNNLGTVTSSNTTEISASGKTIGLNDGDERSDIGGGAGILIRDNNTDAAAFFIQNNTRSGYTFKTSRTNDSNSVNIEINSMKLAPQINTGLIVLKKLPINSDSSFNMELENIDVSSILLRSTTSTYSNQIIDSKLSINDTLITNGDVSMNSRLYVSGDTSMNNLNSNTASITNLGVGIINTSSEVSLDVSGIFRLTNGIVVQFYE